MDAANDRAPGDARVGTVLLGKLRVVRRIGAGGRGVVYEVEHLLTGHRRALKVLRPELSASGEAVARMVREARVASRLDSPFLAETYDVGRLPDGATYVLMELCEGPSLRRLLDETPCLDAARAAGLVASVCEGLAPAHAAGIVHRDLKPENVLVPGEGSGAPVKILDFGLLKDLGGSGDSFGALTAAGAAPGTVEYMAPEQIDGGTVDARADVHALGVILYEALAGARPFQGESLPAIAHRIRCRSPLPLADARPDVEPALAAVVARAMSRDREARFASASELREALLPFAGHGGVASPLAGRRFAEHYEIERLLGTGAMGAVYEAVDRRSGEACALKILRAAPVGEDGLRARLAREARLAAKVAGDHVIRVLDVGVDPASCAPFLVMELLEGRDLGRAVADGGPFDAGEVVRLLSQAARAIDGVHAAGIVHRDVKPGNLFLVERDGGPPLLKVLDFGIATLVDASGGSGPEGRAGVTRGSFGTPLYMAPEQIDGGSVGPSADRLALAHIAFTMLTGEPYWHDEARAGLVPLLARLAQGTRERASVRAGRRGVALSERFDAWFARATHLRAEARFESAAALVAALEDALRAPPASVSRMPRVVIGLAVAACGLAFVAARVSGARSPGAGAAAPEPGISTSVPAAETAPPSRVEPPALPGSTEAPAASASPRPSRRAPVDDRGYAGTSPATPRAPVTVASAPHRPRPAPEGAPSSSPAPAPVPIVDPRSSPE